MVGFGDGTDRSLVWWLWLEFGSVDGWIGDGCAIGDGFLDRSVAGLVMVGG